MNTMNELLAQYREAQKAYIATLEPWLKAQGVKNATEAYYEKLCRDLNGSRPHLSTSHKQHNRALEKWSANQARIERARVEFRAAEKLWKEAKAVRWKALCHEYTLRLKLQPARQTMRQTMREQTRIHKEDRAKRLLAALGAMPGILEVECVPLDSCDLHTAMLAFLDDRESLVVEAPKFWEAVHGLVVAADRIDLFETIR